MKSANTWSAKRFCYLVQTTTIEHGKGIFDAHLLLNVHSFIMKYITFPSLSSQTNVFSAFISFMCGTWQDTLYPLVGFVKSLQSSCLSPFYT